MKYLSILLILITATFFSASSVFADDSSKPVSTEKSAPAGDEEPECD